MVFEVYLQKKFGKIHKLGILFITDSNSGFVLNC